MAELLSGKSLSALMANVSVHDEPAETGRCRLFAPCDISMGVLALFAGLPFCIRTAGIPAGEAEVGRSRVARILRGEQSCAVSARSAADCLGSARLFRCERRQRTFCREQTCGQ